MNIFGIMKILWSLGSSQNLTGFRSHFCAFKGLFLRSMNRIGMYILVAKITNIFLGMPDIIFQIFFGKQ